MDIKVGDSVVPSMDQKLAVVKLKTEFILDTEDEMNSVSNVNNFFQIPRSNIRVKREQTDSCAADKHTNFDANSSSSMEYTLLYKEVNVEDRKAKSYALDHSYAAVSTDSECDDEPFQTETEVLEDYGNQFDVGANVVLSHSENELTQDSVGSDISCGDEPQQYKMPDEAKHSEEKLFSCKKCTAMFKSKGHLQAHASEVHSTSRPFPCLDCSAAFKTKGHLKAHFLRVHSNETPFRCSYCISTFKTKNELKIHLSRLHLNETLLSSKEYAALIMSNTRPFSCTKCTNTFKTKGHLKTHLLRIHSDEEPFACQCCVAAFKTKHELVIHVARIHLKAISEEHASSKPTDNLEPHLLINVKTCQECFATFKTNDELTLHFLSVHSSARPYSCTKCTYAFKTKGHLKTHLLRVHSNETPFQCQECNAAFKTKHQLKVHLSRVHSVITEINPHSNLKPFSCEVCNTRFKSKLECRLHSAFHHLDAHSGVCLQDAKICCGHCGARFFHSNSLKEHLSMHVNEKPVTTDCE